MVEINEIFNIKKYYSLFDAMVSGFVNSNLLKQETEQTFQQHLAEVKYDNPFKNAKITVIENENKEEHDALEVLQKKERKSKKRKLTKNVEGKLEDAFKSKKIKTMIDFDRKQCNSIKSVALKANRNINVTLRFSKMMMLAKILLKSFAYDMIHVFCFATEEVKMIYGRYDIIKCHLYLNLIGTVVHAFSISSSKKNVTSKRAS